MVYIPKICGVCMGSRNAIDLAIKLTREYSNVVIYKEILHNKAVIDYLKENNVNCVSFLDKIKNNMTVVIRAHGEKKSLYDYFQKRNIKYFDATCINVKRIHNLIYEKYKEDYDIVIIGKKSHPEVVGSLGWCDDKGYVVEDAYDVENLRCSKNNVFVVAQTTISEDKFKNLSNFVCQKLYNKNVEVKNTVCLAQKKIQESSVEVAKKCKYTFVIGGNNSSNTRELYNCCSLVSKTYLISSLNDFLSVLDKLPLTLDCDICITGGASTPMFQILQYKKILDDKIMQSKK